MSHYTDDPVADAAAHDDEQDRRAEEREDRAEWLRRFYLAVLKDRKNRKEGENIVAWIDANDCIRAAEAYVLSGPESALRILQDIAEEAIKLLAESEA